MKCLKKHAVRAAALLLWSVPLASPGFAQSGTTGPGPQNDSMQGPHQGGGRGGMRRGGGMEQRLERMQKELSLSAEQTAKVKTILEEGRAQMMAERDSSAAREDRRAKMMSLMQSENAKIKAVLNEDQKTRYEAMQKQQMERMREGRRRGDDGPPPPAPPQ